MHALLTAYSWDVLDEDPAAWVDSLHGEIGVTGLSLWAASPPVTQLRARDVHPRIRRTRGGLFFHPDDARYTSTRLKPLVSDSVKGRHTFGRIAEICAERRMELRVIVSAASTGRLAERHPEMAAKNVFFDASRRSLCLVNPDVQAYLVGLLEDLSSREHVGGVALTDFDNAWIEAFGADLVTPVALGPTERALLSLCFCESCMQRAAQAGLDVEMTVRSVRMLFHARFAGRAGRPVRLDALLADQPPLTAWVDWQGNELNALLRRLVEACACELVLHRGAFDTKVPGADAIDPSIPAALVTEESNIERLPQAWCPKAARNELRVCTRAGSSADAAELVALVAKAGEIGFSGVEFDGPGMIPEATLQSVKQAIRFARRNTSAG